MGRRILLIVAVVLVGLAVWTLALHQGPASVEQAPGESSPSPVPESTPAPGPAIDRTTQMGTSERKPETKPEGQTAPASAPQAPTAPQQPTPLPPPQRSGPVAALKQAFENEPRDSAAQLVESRIENEFRKGDIAPGLLKSVLCRESVCRVEVLWTPERAESFIAAFTRLSADFEPDIALDPHTAAGSPEQLQVDAYLPRLGSKAKPSQH